ncbi:MAG: SDR family oxidoreductase, partial [Kiloniellales bacterium]|nr:SDR family oxidoreductase [Kiloniellales bacterium]
MILKDKVAVITGGASEAGIGGATARLLAAEGARVAILDLADEDPEAAAAELGEGHFGTVCDVRERQACFDAVAAIAAELGGIDILIGNAGVVFGTPLAEIAPAEYNLVMDVNLRGNFQMAQAAVPHLEARGGGSLVFISSIAGQVG